MYSSYVFNKFWTFFQVHIVIIVLLLCYYAIAVYFGHYMTGVEISDRLLWLAVYRSVNILLQLLWAEWKILSEMSYLQLLYITSKQQIYFILFMFLQEKNPLSDILWILPIAHCLYLTPHR